MNNKPGDLSFKEVLKKEFGFDLPISGGFGSSIEDAIKIDKEYLDYSDVVYTCLRLNNRLLNRGWELIEQTNVEKNERIFSQMKIKVEGDDSNYHNYYFDITDHMNAPLFGGETSWPDEGGARKRLQFNPYEEGVSKKIAYALIHAISSNRKTTFKEEFFKSVNELDFYRELNALDSFCMITALQKHYGNSETGMNIAREANSFATDAMLEMGIFQTHKELSEFMKKRFNDYELAYENNKEPGGLWWIGKQFCIFNEIELEPAPIMFISQYFVSVAKANLEFIKGIDVEGKV